jgi:hypothetical protein
LRTTTSPAIVNNNEKKQAGSVRPFDRVPGDPAEMHFSSRWFIENTIRKQWIGVMVASELCSARRAGELARTCRAQSFYCANRPRVVAYLLGPGASGGTKRRNKAIAPYDPHFASFNFTNALICTVASSARVASNHY